MFNNHTFIIDLNLQKYNPKSRNYVEFDAFRSHFYIIQKAESEFANDKSDPAYALFRLFTRKTFETISALHLSRALSFYAA